MSTFILLLVLTAPPESTQAAPESPGAPSPQSQAESRRPYYEIHQDLRSLLRQEARHTDPDQWRLVVVQLTQLYGEITHDKRFPTSDTLNAYRIKLRSRLLTIQKRLERDLAASDASADDHPTADTSQTAVEPLPAPSTSPAKSLSRSATASDSAATSLQGAAGGAPRADDGDVLVELIRRTIAPDFWDVNGGPGTIVYYRQWQALVVRATAEVHERIGGAVEGLGK